MTGSNNVQNDLPSPPNGKTNRTKVVILLLIQGITTGVALVMSYWAKVPWLGLLGLVGLGVGAMVAQLVTAARTEQFWKRLTQIAWACTLAVPASLWLLSDELFTIERFLDRYYAMLAWLMAAMILPTSHRVVGAGLKKRWRLVMMAWALAGNLLWLATAYLKNQFWAFHLGLMLSLAWLVFFKLSLHPGTAVTNLVNTLILMAAGLPLTGLFFHAHRGITTDPQVLRQYSQYRTGCKNLGAFEKWWNYFGTEYHQLELKLLIKEPSSSIPIRLRANSRAKLLQSEISINQHGFRGREIDTHKGEAYRIVAIGESTTFGFTLDPEDKPWPELLEQLIRERLKPDRPVEVINAGIPGITLPENLNRLSEEILPLKPDMIIGHHGINGFSLLNDALPPFRGAAPPNYRKRPLRLLADCEYNLKLLVYRHSQRRKLFFKSPTFSNLAETKYAQAYKQLIQTAKNHGIRLVISNFPLAVNQQSPPDVAEFFRPLHPVPVYWHVKANVAHNILVQQLGREHPEVCFVDVQPHLDGDYNKYLDLMHLTQEGDRQLAENFFAGIQPLLETDLASLRTKSVRNNTK